MFDAVWCHCSLCRRFGVPAAATFNVATPDFALLRGTPRAFRSSSFFTRQFCPECGTHVFGTDARPPQPGVGTALVSVAIGTLDDPAAVAPRIHQWWGDRVPWFESWTALRGSRTGRCRIRRSASLRRRPSASRAHGRDVACGFPR